MMLALLFLPYGLAYAQTEEISDVPEVPTVVPASPEAANLGKYGEIDVSLYTGKPNISIPLYNVKTGELSFPINLYYDASGIRVAQEATWVGLGWELSCVNAVTYRPVGGNEQLSALAPISGEDWSYFIDYFKSSYPSVPYVQNNNYYYYMYLTTDDNCWLGSSPSNYPSILNVYPSLQGYKQIDLYSVNCAGLTFQFYIDPITKLPQIVGENKKVRIEMIEGDMGGISGIRVTNDTGIKYTFSDIENYSGSTLINAWFLSSIESPDNRWISFSYANEGSTHPIRPFNEYITSGTPAQEGHVQHLGGFDPSQDELMNVYLSKIETNKEVISFYKSADRADINGDGAVRLDSITIANKGGNSVKNVHFEYSQFEGVPIAENSAYTEDDFYTMRLKLTGLSIITPDNQQDYSFSYQETHALPYKTSFAQDYWGYYNGESNSTLIPNLFPIQFMTSEDANIIGNDEKLGDYLGDDLFGKAHRGVNPEYITAGMLKAVQYPTGGRTEYSFEANTINNQTILSSHDEDFIEGVFRPYISLVQAGSTGLAVESFSLSDSTQISLTGSFSKTESCSSSGFIRIGGYNISKNWNFTEQGQIDTTITLPSGSYDLRCYLSASCNSWETAISATVRFPGINKKDSIINAANAESYACGVRIQEIRNYDNNDSLLSIRKYSYTNPDGSTSGKLLEPLKLTEYGVYQGDWTESILSKTTGAKRFTSSALNASVVFNNAKIGYDRVEVENIGIEGEKNGKVITSFSNSPASQMFNFLNYDVLTLENGSMKDQVTLNSSGDTINKITYGYAIKNAKNNLVNCYAKSRWQGGQTYACQNDKTPTSSTIQLIFYPYLSYNKFLTEKNSTEYYSNKKVTSSEYYTYDIDDYFLTSHSIILNSDTLLSQYLYPKDFYTSNPVGEEDMLIKYMVDSFMVNIPIGMTKYLSGEPIAYNFTQMSFFQDGNQTGYSSLQTDDYFVIKPWKKYIMSCAPGEFSPTVMDAQGRFMFNDGLNMKIILDRYDNIGNLLQYQTQDSIFNSFIWSYNESLPVVKVEGMNYTSLGVIAKKIESLNFSNSIEFSNIQADVQLLKNELSPLFSDISCQVTFFTYAPLVGMTSQTDPNGVTTYYEYDSFGRLRRVRDNEGNIIKENKYNYKK